MKPEKKPGSETCCSPGSNCCSKAEPGGLGRRDFVKLAGLTAGSSVLSARPASARSGPAAAWAEVDRWSSFRRYDGAHLDRIAMPIGGIGTGTVSLGGRGDLRDWEIMNRPAKGFVPSVGDIYPCFILYARDSEGRHFTRLVEGPLGAGDFEGSHGSKTPNDNLPRFAQASFDSAYPFGQVSLSDSDLPLKVRIRAFNPLIPGDPEDSGLPVALLAFDVVNQTDGAMEVAICGTLPNFIGMDGWELERDWKGDQHPVGTKGNRNQYRETDGIRGIFFSSDEVDPLSSAWGTMALATPSRDQVTFRTGWDRIQWGNAWLDFWDDFSADGKLEPRDVRSDMPIASLAIRGNAPARGAWSTTFLLSWHFPNRYTWTPRSGTPNEADRIGNYYTTRFADAWEVAADVSRRAGELQQKTQTFARSFYGCDLPDVVKEAAGFTLTALRSQTSFRTPDGRFFGFEGCGNQKGCCHGSCTHVWNYEQATAFLFGDLARSMREVEFAHATDNSGMMSFRVNLPLERAREFGKAAADGQMGCIMKMYRDWRLSGDRKFLEQLWPKVRKALEFCWIPGGWDADQDGVMEGCQHNTMDVEYYGPNPQMEGWYLGALKAAAAMAREMEDVEFAERCDRLFENGSRWTDENLFNGEYFEHQVRPPRERSDIAPSLLIGMGAADPTHPEFQLASGCLVDQLVGQFMAHVCGLGYLLDRDHVSRTLSSILKYNQRDNLSEHFNAMRSFALANEAGLLMADYPGSRPENPFPYFSEVMTGFEYTAAVGMLYESMTEEGLNCIRHVRERYDGRKRSPFDEAECGHHYARAMASWASVLAWTGFQFDGLHGVMTFTSKPGKWFWSNGEAWGSCAINRQGNESSVNLQVHGGRLEIRKFTLGSVGAREFDPPLHLGAGESQSFQLEA